MDLYTKLSSCMEDLSSTFSTRMGQYEQDLKAASSNESPHKTIASLSRDFMEFKCLIWKTMSALKSQMELLVVGLDRHEMASRRPVLLLHGLPEQKEEVPAAQAVLVIRDKMKIELSSMDIAACHRLGVSLGKPRPLLIRFGRLELRNDIWRSKPRLKGTGLIMSEFLTKPRHDVFMAARKHFGVQQCWTTEGKITISLPDKSRRKIECASELQDLVLRFPAASSIVEPILGKPAADKRARRQVK